MRLASSITFRFLDSVAAIKSRFFCEAFLCCKLRKLPGLRFAVCSPLAHDLNNTFTECLALSILLRVVQFHVFEQHGMLLGDFEIRV